LASLLSRCGGNLPARQAARKRALASSKRVLLGEKPGKESGLSPESS
jgi:hypothetical protein